MKFKKLPIVIDATQWFKNGDHPEDGHGISWIERARHSWYAGQRLEGKVVRYFRHPDISGESACRHCGLTMHVHGWIDTKEGGHIVCPGDWIITGVQGERYPCKPDIFETTYVPLE